MGRDWLGVRDTLNSYRDGSIVESVRRNEDETEDDEAQTGDTMTKGIPGASTRTKAQRYPKYVWRYLRRNL